MSRRVGQVVLATTITARDLPLVDLAEDLGVPVHRGPEDDVLSRFVAAACEFNADPIVRITADCPLIDFELIDDVIAYYERERADYTFVQGYPLGLGAAEVIGLPALERAQAQTNLDQTYYREHVMTYLTDHPDRFRLHVVDAPMKYRRPELRLCVDEELDLEVVRRVCEHFSPRLDFVTAEIIDFLHSNPALAALNQAVRQKTR